MPGSPNLREEWNVTKLSIIALALLATLCSRERRVWRRRRLDNHRDDDYNHDHHNHVTIGYPGARANHSARATRTN